MPSHTGELLDALMAGQQVDHRPWGFMHCLGASSHDLTIKYLAVRMGERTSEQYHKLKDELLVIIGGTGHVYAADQGRVSGAGAMVRIRPGVVHRVTGWLTYLEVSTYDDGTDTVRVSDDYDRT
jgi:mannose-6-phosphate isomerase-like protein (cupin superfamily)